MYAMCTFQQVAHQIILTIEYCIPICLYQYSHKTLFGTSTMLCNVVQLLQVSKLKNEPAILGFCQVAPSKLFHISYDHYTVSASFTVHLYASQTQPESPNNFYLLMSLFLSLMMTMAIPHLHHIE